MADNGTMIQNLEKFDEHAENIERKNREMRQTLDNIQKRINSLKGDWESKSAETIRQKINNMTDRFEGYQQVVNNYAKFIRNTKVQIMNLENTINNNASQFK